MSGRRLLKLVHLGGTAWLVLCLSFLLIIALREAGVHWWLIFSLSGYSMLFVFLLVSLYLFAIFRGIGENRSIEAEHPLTNTSYYTTLYLVAPFLGCLAGCLGMIGVQTASEFAVGISLGTLCTTFLVWIIIDPVVGVIEMLLPASLRHRHERLAQLRAARHEQIENRRRLLESVLAEDQEEQQRLAHILKPYAEKLADLLTWESEDFSKAENEAVSIGVIAWRIGGRNCMERLKNMASNLYEERASEPMACDYISNWWDGIGSWRNPSFC
jgi:hypothetical protein